MIVFYGQGGLGNQLFQYAAARSLALAHGCPLVLDPYWFSHQLPGETRWPLQLTSYPLLMRMASEFEQNKWTWMRSRLARCLRPLLALNLVREEGYAVNEQALRAPINSYMVGYWQSEAYFAGIRSQLLEELSPTMPPGPGDLAMMNRMRTGTPVSLHVRRGDYVSLPSAAAYHGLCSLHYYRAAMAYVAERVADPVFFVFSDDPEWTRANLSSPYPTHYVDHNTPEDAFQDLRLMSICRHHIIANSSFSWWGAWLAPLQDGLVVEA